MQYIEKGENAFVMSLEGNYTPDDWVWLMDNLND